MTTEPPRTLREKIRRTLSPHLEVGGNIGREEMDAFGWFYLVVILVFAIPFIPLLVVLTVLYSMWQSFGDTFRHPRDEQY